MEIVSSAVTSKEELRLDVESKVSHWRIVENAESKLTVVAHTHTNMSLEKSMNDYDYFTENVSCGE